MRRRIPVALLALPIVLLLTGCAKKGADLVYRNGRIFTANVEEPWVEAVAVARGKFVCVGSNAEVQGFVGMQTVARDLDGSFVLPGAVRAEGAPYHLEPPDRVLLVEPISEERFFAYAQERKGDGTG